MPVTAREIKWHTKDEAEFNLIAACDKPGCYYRCAVNNSERGNELLTIHACPMKGRTVITKSLLEESWDLLDECVNWLKLHEEIERDFEEDSWAELKHKQIEMKGEARGLAKMLAIFMHPHYQTWTDISRESLRRWQAHQANEDDYQTTGLTSFAPPPGNLRPQVTSPAYVKPKGATQTLSLAERDMIKEMWPSGMFTVEQLAKTISRPVLAVENYVRTIEPSKES